MPFSHVASQYQPEQLESLSAAFDKAWPQVLLSKRPNPEQLEWLRRRLANYILACASQRQFDPDKITEQALRAFIERDKTAA